MASALEAMASTLEAIDLKHPTNLFLAPAPWAAARPPCARVGRARRITPMMSSMAVVNQGSSLCGAENRLMSWKTLRTNSNGRRDLLDLSGSFVFG